MKNSYIIPVFIGAMTLASCAKDYDCTIEVDKPESVVQAEQIASLDVLKSYIDRSQNPNFTLGVSVSSADYASQGLTYSIAKTNFDAVVDASALAYNTIIGDDGAVTLNSITDMFLEDAPAVLGGPMLTYNALNKAQLEQVISPNFIKGDLEQGKLTLTDFESDAVGTTYEMTAGSVATVVEDPKGESGNVLQIGSPENKAKNSYAEINITLPDGLTLGDLQVISFDIFCVDGNSQKKPLVMILNGQRKNYTGDTPEKRGCPTGTWARRIIELKVSDVDKLTDDDRKLSTFTLALGPNVLNSYYYIDNISATWKTGNPDKYEEKTPAEKSQALADNFDVWATSIMTSVAPTISEYVVVANPMSDDDAYMLRDSANETELGNDTAESFFFNEYMGDNYVANVTSSLKKAYSANGGNGNLKLYVSESGLLGNPGKVTRLLDQISKWTAAGAQIDGIAVNLPLVYSADAAEQKANEEAVVELFKALSTSGKLIRLDNVSMANADADFYKFVINQYFANITGDKRGGIIFNGTGDLWRNATRTDVYQAVIEALK